MAMNYALMLTITTMVGSHFPSLGFGGQKWRFGSLLLLFLWSFGQSVGTVSSRYALTIISYTPFLRALCG